LLRIYSQDSDQTIIGKMGVAVIKGMQVSSVTRPVKELKGFQRVTLKAGETKPVEFKITPESLAFWDIKMNYTVEPGKFNLMVGNSSRDEDLKSIELTIQ